MAPHWTNEQLIAHLYGVGPEDGHLPGCEECESRLAQLVYARHAVENSAAAATGVSFDFLAAQRRSIYARLTADARWWRSKASIRKFASVMAMVTALAGGLAYYAETHHSTQDPGISDVQLAQEVSAMAQDAEPGPTAPLQGLFVE